MENILYLKEELDRVHADNDAELREVFKEFMYHKIARQLHYYECMTDGNLIQESQVFFMDYVVISELCAAFNFAVNDMPEGFMKRLERQINRSLNYIDRPTFNSTNVLGNLIEVWKQKGHREFLNQTFVIVEQFNIDQAKKDKN